LGIQIERKQRGKAKTMRKKIRVLAAKPGLDGHDRGIKVVCNALRDAGMEVIYAGLRQTPLQIVNTALQEDVNVVALSILSGAHNSLLPRVADLLRDRKARHILLIAGGIIPDEDIPPLVEKGFGRIFGPGTTTTEIISYIKDVLVAREEEGEKAYGKSGERAENEY
jgi:methylmalonyl-CoA mutase, C-terminal domain